MSKIKAKIINFGKRYHGIIFLARKINFLRHRLLYMFYYITTDENLIIFEVFGGRKYWDSPQALYEEMLKDEKYAHYKFVWAFKNTEKYQFLEKNNSTIVVKSESRDYYKYYAKAKYWIVNYRISDVFKNQNSEL